MIVKIISILIAILPILSSYKGLFPGFDLGTSTVLLIGLYMLVNRPTLRREKNTPDAVVWYVFTLSPICFALSSVLGVAGLPSILTAVLRYGRFVLVYIILFYTKTYDTFDFAICMKCIRVVVYIATVFVVFQRLFYAFGMQINNPFANYAINEAYYAINYTMGGGSGLFRPSAFFLEPASYAQYTIVYLCYMLFNETRRQWIDIIATIAGILCTGSGIGVSMIIGLFILFLFTQRTVSWFKRVIIIVVAAIVLFYLLQLPFFQNVLSRIFTDATEFGGNAVKGRIGDGYKIFLSMPLLIKIVGCGYGNIVQNNYFNGFAYMLNTIGIIGCCVFLISMFEVYRRNSNWAKIVIVSYIVLLLAAQLFNISYFCFILYICVFGKRITYWDKDGR